MVKKKEAKTRIDVDTLKKLDSLVVFWGFKSRYELLSSIISVCAEILADKMNVNTPSHSNDISKEIRDMFSDFSEVENVINTDTFFKSKHKKTID